MYPNWTRHYTLSHPGGSYLSFDQISLAISQEIFHHGGGVTSTHRHSAAAPCLLRHITAFSAFKCLVHCSMNQSTQSLTECGALGTLTKPQHEVQNRSWRVPCHYEHGLKLTLLRQTEPEVCSRFMGNLNKGWQAMTRRS